MRDNGKQGCDGESAREGNRFARRDLLGGTAGVLVGSLAVATTVASGTDDDEDDDTVTIDVKGPINLDSRGVIPVSVEVVDSEVLPVKDNQVMGPRFGPSRLFQCSDPQRPDQDRCALEEAIENDDGAPPAHGFGHQLSDTKVMFHFKTQEADFIQEDMEKEKIEVTLIYDVDDNTDNGSPVIESATVTLSTPSPTPTDTPTDISESQ